jgi:hypothetical protein
MSSHGEKKNPDKMNTVTIVTVGLTGAALVYISIIAIEALYLNETSRVDEVAAFGKQGDVRTSLRTTQIGNITEARIRTNVLGLNNVQLYSIPIDEAKRLVLHDAKQDPANLVPAVTRSEFTTIKPVFGRPSLLPSPVGLGLSAPPPVVPDPAAAVPGGTAPTGQGTEAPPTAPAAGGPAPAAAAAPPAGTQPAAVPLPPPPTGGSR